MEKKKEDDLEEFIQRHGIKLTKKKRNQLLENSNDGYEIWKLGIEIANCCKVRTLLTIFLMFFP
jgi:hypothetical protein